MSRKHTTGLQDRRILFALSLFFWVSVIFVSGQQPKNQKDALGRKQGYWEAVDRNGKLVYTGYFKDNKPVGEMKRYHPSGGVRVIMIYDNKSEKARSRFFWQSGELAAQGNYINTKRDSIWTYYSYYSKNVSYKAGYKMGKRDGKSYNFYPNGEIAEETTWRNDLQDGPWRQYFDDKKLKLSATYVNGKLEGAFQIFYPDGKKETEGAYRNNLPDGKWLHYKDDGTIASTIEYVNGQITNLDELEASEQEFFKKLEEQEGKIKEPTIEDLIREANK